MDTWQLPDEVYAMWKRSLMVLCMSAAFCAPALAQEAAVPPAHQHVDAAEHAEGPKHQLVEFDPAEAIWVIIIFVILLAILYPTAWKAVLAGLKAREQRIRGDLESAEQERLKAQQTLKEYEVKLAAAQDQIRQMLGKAQTDAEKIATSIRVHAQQEAEQAKERATKEIEASRDQALSEIYRQAAEISTSIAEKILRRNLNADDQQDLVRSSLDQLQAINRG
jgi:F-type H+-transporting ATPase subunit b